MASRARVLVAAAALVAAVFSLAWVRSAEGADRCEVFAAQGLDREAVVTGAGQSVVVIGDSWSAGWAMADPAASWPTRLPGRIEVRGFPSSGFSVGASACPGVEFAARVPAAATTADLVVFQGGLNDFDQSEANIRAGLRAAIDGLAARQVVVVGPASAPARARGAARVDGILAAACADADVRYVSMLDLELPYLPDGLHLTDAGHRTFGDAVAARLASGESVSE